MTRKTTRGPRKEKRKGKEGGKGKRTELSSTNVKSSAFHSCCAVQ
jgi:hypothetical protein